MKNEQVKVNKWDTNAVKQELDNYVRKYIFEVNDFQENHSLNTFTIVLHSLLLVINYFNYFHAPMPQKKFLLYSLCASHAFLTLILFFLSKFFQKDQILQTTSRDHPEKIFRVRSTLKKDTPDYTLHFERSHDQKKAFFTKPYSSWFTAEGVFLEKLFEEDIKNNLSILFPNLHKKNK